jgi:hypothetical protein
MEMTDYHSVTIDLTIFQKKKQGTAIGRSNVPEGTASQNVNTDLTCTKSRSRCSGTSRYSHVKPTQVTADMKVRIATPRVYQVVT